MQLIISGEVGHREPLLLHALAFARTQTSLPVEERITALEDYKGKLTVHWKVMPADIERSAFEFAWESVGEPSSEVEHIMSCCSPRWQASTISLPLNT